MSDSTGRRDAPFISNEGATFNAPVFQAQTQNFTGPLFAGGSPDAEALKRELARLEEQLGALPPAEAQAGAAVQETAKALVSEANKAEANPGLLKAFGAALTTAAQAVAEHAPTVLTTAGAIVKLVAKLRGLG